MHIYIYMVNHRSDRHTEHPDKHRNTNTLILFLFLAKQDGGQVQE